jgi:hypothetical protein
MGVVIGRLCAESSFQDVLAGLLTERRVGCDVERTVYLAAPHGVMVSGSDRHAGEWLLAFHVSGAEVLDLDHADEDDGLGRRSGR